MVGEEVEVEVAVKGLSSEGNVIVLGVLRGGSTGLLFGAMVVGQDVRK
jgi:hypothetical protein